MHTVENLENQEERKPITYYFMIQINTIITFTSLFPDPFSTPLYIAEILLYINCTCFFILHYCISMSPCQ